MSKLLINMRETFNLLTHYGTESVEPNPIIYFPKENPIIHATLNLFSS
jgi:hypothetical protein